MTAARKATAAARFRQVIIPAIFALAGAMGVERATAQAGRDLPLPIPSMTAGRVRPASWETPDAPAPSAEEAPSPQSGGVPPGNSALRQRLRAAASRMAAEEVPPPLPQPASRDAGPAPVAPDAWRKPVLIPPASQVPADRVEIHQSGDRVSLSVRELPLNRLLMLMAQQLGVNIVCADNLTSPVSVTLEKVTLEDAMTAVCSAAGACWAVNNGIVHVSSVNGTSKLPAEIQGRQVRVFRLDYVAAKDVETAIKPMLSPVGQSFVTETKLQDNRRTQEVVTVQDLPSYLRPIEQCITELDRAPRQVLIEAHILDVDLKNELKHGVDFKNLFAHLAQANLQSGAIPEVMQDVSLANPAGAFLFTFNGSHFNIIVQALRTQSDARTLASPKVLVLNGQEARLQVGDQLGYYVRTTTETSTMQSVNFLDVGTILKVTPRITADNQILMHVKPEVSGGFVSEAGLPNSNTTQVETDVILPDGRGMVLGGLIREEDTEEQQKVPMLGDLWLVGRIFQHRRVVRERREIIICLLPRIVPEQPVCDSRHESEVMRSQTPLLTEDLQRYPRPRESILPDAVEKPYRVKDHLPACRRDITPSTPYDCPVESVPYYGGPPMPSAPLPPFQLEGSGESRRREAVRPAAHKTVTYPEPSPRPTLSRSSL